MIETYFKGHCRMPKYVRSKKGIVVHITPPFPFASAAGHGLEAKREPRRLMLRTGSLETTLARTLFAEANNLPEPFYRKST